MKKKPPVLKVGSGTAEELFSHYLTMNSEGTASAYAKMVLKYSLFHLSTSILSLECHLTNLD